MDVPKVEIFIINEEENNHMTYSRQVPKTIKNYELRDLITDNNLTKLIYFNIVWNNKLYDRNNLSDILNLEEGDKVRIIPDRVDEKFNGKFYTNKNLNEEDLATGKLTGILKVILIRYISSFIKDENAIQNEEIKKIIHELKEGMKFEENTQEDIKSNLSEVDGKNIMAYSNYVCSVIDEKEIENLINLLEQNIKNEIKKYWSSLSKYEEFNKHFEVCLSEAIEKSYFDYSLVGLSLYEQKNRKEFIKKMEECENLVLKYLFHGTQLDPTSKIITNGFLYARKPFYGMGIYFSDMLDYVSFYSGGTDFNSRRLYFGKILPINITFTCVAAEVFYSKHKLKEIFDFSYGVKELDHFPTYEEIVKDYSEKKVQPNGVHFARIEPNKGQVRDKESIKSDQEKGKFIGTEYVITEMDQILPLYGLTFRRNEYFVIWKDPNFKGKNIYSDYLKQRKAFIYEIAKMNAYFESSTEKALEIIKRKKFNKIILISNIGLDLSGKKFVEIAREILGFDVVVLFFSNNNKHLSWLQEFPNALYTNDSSFYKEYISNYNEKGLLDLKSKIEKSYKIKLNFTDDFMKFPKFINQEKYEDIIFEEPSPNFKKVIIKNSENCCILCMDKNRNTYFCTTTNLDVNLYVWTVTIIKNEITLFSNNSYLGADLKNGKVIGEQFMKRFQFEKDNSYEYILYYENKDNILTVDGVNAKLQKESINKSNQKFKLIEAVESI